MWTQFWDMSSGGSQKLDFKHCYIEAPEAEAKIIFQNLFGRNPERVTCTCCGGDYSISEEENIEQMTAFHRGCEYDKETDSYIEKEDPRKFSFVKFLSFEEYKKQPDVKFIFAADILPEHRVGELNEEGYVWK